jgi:signal transduction histidine kinase
VAGVIAIFVGELGFFLSSTLPMETLVLDLAVSIVSIGVGLAMWWRLPDNRSGFLLYLVGVLWAIAGIVSFDNPIIWAVGFALLGVQDVVLGHLILAYPSGRLTTRPAKITIAIAYATVVIGFLRVPFFGPEACGCPALVNGFLLFDSPPINEALIGIGAILGAGVIISATTIAVSRWVRSGPAGRRNFGPILLVAIFLALALLVEIGVDELGEAGPFPRSLVIGNAIFRLLVPLAFLWGLMRTTLDRASVGQLVVDLDSYGPSHGIQEILANRLHDPTLQLVFWVDRPPGYIDGNGVTVDPAQPRRAFTKIESRGQPLAGLIHDPTLLDEARTVEAAVAATRLVIERERLQAEVRSHLDEIRASRARIVEATEDERRRIERDLHDGAQQRLLALGMGLRLARENAGDAETVAALLEVEQDAREALTELRELAQGIYPAILTSEGVGPAVETVAERCGVPVNVDIEPKRFPTSIEAAAYFLIAEALTNVGKHANASHALVEGQAVGDTLRLRIADDGDGGADANVGTGLRGMADRVAACGGNISIVSPPMGGTEIVIELPLDEVS